MGMMQQIRDEGHREGRREGLLHGIEVLLKHRFGDAGLSALAEIRRVEDVALLDRICDSFETVENIDALRRIYSHDES